MFCANECVSISNQSQYSKEEVTASYCVKECDTLCRIAVNYDTTTSYLMKLNKLSSTFIFPGQVLQVPSGKCEKTVSKELCPDEDDLSVSFASNIEDAYAFLSPLCVSTAENNSSTLFTTQKPFKDLAMVSSSLHEKTVDYKIDEATELCHAAGSASRCNSFQTTNGKLFFPSTISADETATRERLPSIESIVSEPFEENFLKMSVHFLAADQLDTLCYLAMETGLTDFFLVIKNIMVNCTRYEIPEYSFMLKNLDISLQDPLVRKRASRHHAGSTFCWYHQSLSSREEHVRGILLVTPASVMFDPDPLCPLAKEHGCEKFGMMCDLKNIVSLTMYRDTATSDGLILGASSSTLKEVAEATRDDYLTSDSHMIVNSVSAFSCADQVADIDCPKLRNPSQLNCNRFSNEAIPKDFPGKSDLPEADHQSSAACFEQS